ncbi:MAG: hypothetical protein FJ149_08600 [Euryarchaeota archaeon]|nr:hypothetical protein [Euryarchaeota archaeon]
MNARVVAGLALALFLVPSVLAFTALADRGGIPLDREVVFEESAQNAIVGWNGEKECLVLSTDLRSPRPGRLMEMLPLPSAPYDIQTGNTSSFTTMVKLYNEKMKRLDVSPDSGTGERTAGLGGDSVGEFQGISIVFSASVGVHDITVVRIESQAHFLQWAQSFAASQGVSDLSIDERLNRSVGEHLNRGIPYFVFDVVTLSADKRTAEPLVYLFNTSYLYYPLKITYDTLPDQYTARNQISVFLVADGVVREGRYYSSGTRFTGGIDEYLEFSETELGRVCAPLGALFSRSAFAAHLSGDMQVHYYEPESVKDVVLRAEDFRRPTDAELRAQYERADMLRAIKPLAPSLAYYLLRSAYDPEYDVPQPLLGLILLGIFVGPVALGMMFKGIIERGYRRSPLWVAWFVLYIIGMVGVFGMYTLASAFSGVEYWFLVLFLGLFVPLIVVISMGEWLRTRLSSRKYVVGTVAYGMAVTQVLVFVFTPSEVLYVPVSILCFPAIGIAGVIIVAIGIAARLRERSALWVPPGKH